VSKRKKIQKIKIKNIKKFKKSEIDMWRWL